MANAPKLALVLMSPELEKLHAAAMMGSVAATSGMDVNIFVTMGAAKMFRKDTVEKQDFILTEMGKVILEKKVDLYYKMLEDAKELGELKVYICALAADLMGWKREDFLDMIEDVVGVVAFFGMAEGAQIVTV